MASCWGMFVYKLLTSIVKRWHPVGGRWRCCNSSIRWELFRRKDWVSSTAGFRRLSRNREMLAVGPLQPETIGLICGGVLCIFFRKSMTCVRVGLGGQRYWCSVSSISPASFSSFNYVVMLVAIVSVMSVGSCLYVFVSDKCCPFVMYSTRQKKVSVSNSSYSVLL